MGLCFEAKAEEIVKERANYDQGTNVAVRYSSEQSGYTPLVSAEP